MRRISFILVPITFAAMIVSAGPPAQAAPSVISGVLNRRYFVKPPKSNEPVW